MYFNKKTKIVLSLATNPGTNGSIIYNNLFNLYKLNFIYLPREIKTIKQFNEIINFIKKNSLNFLGCSISMPFKEKAFFLSDKKHSSASNTKSANTLIVKKNNLIAYNTDFLAINLIFKNLYLNNKIILILGAGGLSKSFLYYFKNKSKNIYIYNRSNVRFKSLSKVNSKFTKIELKNLKKIKPNIVINTIPLSDENKIFNNINFDILEILFDSILTKKSSALIKKVKNKRIKIFDGFNLFKEQNKIQKKLYLDAL